MDYNHESMQLYRKNWREQQSVLGVPLGLRINYDQLCKNRHHAPKRKLRKPRDEIGVQKETLDPRYLPANRGLTRSIEEAFGTRGSSPSLSDGRAPGEDARYDMVQYYQEACTLVTSTWADGTRGPLIQIYPEGVVNHRVMQAFNKLYPGRHFVMSSESVPHFMNGVSTRVMHHTCFKPALKRKRRMLSEPVSTPASLLVDAFQAITAGQLEKI